MYYAGTVSAIRETIRKASPECVAEELPVIKKCHLVPLSHLLWMCEGIEKMDISSWEDAIKATSWLAYINREMEIQGFWDNSLSRDFVREDKKYGWHKPHQK